MPFEYVDSLSLPGRPDAPNEDAFAFQAEASVVFDGATGLGERLLPGPSDAAWIARLGADRLLTYAVAGADPREAVRLALHDAKIAFEKLRLRAPAETYEIPFASMMFAVETPPGVELHSFGDCTALVRGPNEKARLVGEAMEKRGHERARVKAIAAETGLNPAAAGVRDAFLPSIRRARNLVNTERGGWLFGPDIAAAGHTSCCRIGVPADSLILLMTDGFFALVSDYERYDPDSLMRAAETKGLAALGGELRSIEEDDPDGVRYPRFKRSDDATALLLRVLEM